MGYTTFDKVSGKNGLAVGAKGSEVVVASSTGGLYQAGTLITATAAELNLLDNMWNTFTTTATPASGTCGVQFVFKDVAGTTMATPVAGTFYLSEVSTGLTVDAADTSIAVLTNGVVNIVDTGVAKYYNYVTTAAGLLGLTITAAADDYYVVFLHPTGKLSISTVCTVNA